MKRKFHGLAYDCDKYENAWGEIVSAVGVVSQIDEPVLETEGVLA